MPPFKSEAQRRLMYAVANGAHVPGLTPAVAKKFIADSRPKKAQGGALRLIGKQPGSRVAGRMMGRAQTGVIATADRQLAAARKRLDGMPGAVKKGFERGGRTPQGF